MRTLLITVFLFSWARSQLMNDDGEYIPLTPVHALTTKDFDSFLQENPKTLIYFYSPWSVSCKNFNKEFESLSIRTSHPDVSLGKVDASIEINLAINYKIRAHPTLLFFLNGKPMIYQEALVFSKIDKWLTKKQHPLVKEIASESELLEVSRSHLAYLFYSLEKNAPQLKLAEEISAKNFQTLFYFTQLESAARFLKESNKFNFIAFRRFNDGNKSISSKTPFKTEELDKFIKDTETPLVLAISEETLDDSMRQTKNSIICFYDSEKESKFLPIYEKVAGQKTGGLIFIKAPHNDPLSIKLKEMVDADEFQETIRIVEYKEHYDMVYHFTKDISEENLLQFIEDFEAGLLIADERSDPVPETNDGPLIKIVGSTFDEIIYDEHKTILLVVTSDRCSLCYHFREWFLPFLATIKKVKNLVFAEFNMSTNSHPVITDSAVPAVYMFLKRRKRHPIFMEEDHDEQGMRDFLFRTLNIRFDHVGKLRDVEEEL